MKNKCFERKSVLCLLLLLSLLAFVRIALAGGGEGNCPYSIDGGTLTIGSPSGSCTLGSNDDEDLYFFPWANNENITKVIIQGSVKTSASAVTLFGLLKNAAVWEGLENLDVSASTNFNNMFKKCYKLPSLEGLENWNVSNVTNMSGAFWDCDGLTSLEDIKDWNVSNVADMGGMFLDCDNLTNLTGIRDWDVRNVTDMYLMFSGCSAVQKADFSGQYWDFSKSGLDHGDLLKSVNGAAVKLNQYNADMSGSNLYVVGKHNCSELGLSADPGNLIYEPFSVLVSFTGGTGTATLTENSYTGDYYDKVCAQFPNEAICTAAVKGSYNSGTTVSITNITPGNTEQKIVSVIAADEKGNKTTLAAPDYQLENIQSNYTVEVQLGYTLTYEPGAGVSGDVPEAEDYKAGATVTVAGNTGDLTKTGYVFKGWKGTINGETKTYAAGETFIMPAANVTLTAVFTSSYTITYVMGEALSGKVPAAQSAAEGEIVTLAYNTGDLAKGDIPFIGWLDENSTPYTEGQQFAMPGHDMTLKPNFSSAQYTLSYDGTGAESGAVPPAQPVYAGMSVTVSGNTGNLAKAGYVFKGWVDSADETQTYAEGDTLVMPARNVTLKVVFEPNSYTLTYVSEGADSGDVPEAVTVSAGTSVTIAGNDGGLSKSGFVFFAWTDGIRQYRPGTELVMPQANVTLRPVFQEEYIKNPEPLPEDEIGTYSFDENGMKIYIQFHNYDICMAYMNDEDLCRNTSTNLYN